MIACKCWETAAGHWFKLHVSEWDVSPSPFGEDERRSEWAARYIWQTDRQVESNKEVIDLYWSFHLQLLFQPPSLTRLCASIADCCLHVWFSLQECVSQSCPMHSWNYYPPDVESGWGFLPFIGRAWPQLPTPCVVPLFFPTWEKLSSPEISGTDGSGKKMSARDFQTSLLCWENTQTHTHSLIM